MGLINAQRLAHKVTEKYRSNKLVNIGETMREVGYAPSTCLEPSRITRGKTYIKLTKPLLDGMHEDIKRLQLAMSSKDLKDEDLRALAYTYDITIKNYQLLSGGATERQVFVLPSEVLESNRIQIVNDVNIPDGSVKPSLNDDK